MKYSSYSNELIDQYSNNQKIFNKVESRLEQNAEVVNYRKAFKKVWMPFCNSLMQAIKFKLLGGSFLLSDDDNPIEVLNKFVDKANLPYELIVIEMDSFVSGPTQDTPMLILLKQVDDFVLMQFAIKGSDWEILEKNNELVSLQFNVRTKDLTLMVALGDEDSEKEVAEQLDGFLFRSGFAIFVSFVCALSCGNTVIEDSSIQPSKIKNSIRKSKGKLPFFTHKILTIDTQSSTKNQSTKSGSHNSPRVHLRRGHIRRLPNKNVWVNSCVVGDKSKGMVSKDYLVVQS